MLFVDILLPQTGERARHGTFTTGHGTSWPPQRFGTLTWFKRVGNGEKTCLWANLLVPQFHEIYGWIKNRYFVFGIYLFSAVFWKVKCRCFLFLVVGIGWLEILGKFRRGRAWVQGINRLTQIDMVRRSFQLVCLHCSMESELTCTPEGLSEVHPPSNRVGSCFCEAVQHQSWFSMIRMYIYKYTYIVCIYVYIEYIYTCYI